jgi:Ser/Thr protein kinase RdoA (MazF antagonist)
MGICHCDFHFSNVLFKDNSFKALLDFDDANYTFLMFDLVTLIESWAWRHDLDKELDFVQARKILAEYQKYRQLNDNEKRHLFDLYKLSVLFDCVWYFGRGMASDFYEKRKVEFLNTVGREEFYNQLFV